MTENEKQKEGDDLTTCLVIHVSLLSCTFLETADFQKGLSFTNHLQIWATECSDYSTQNQQTKNACADLFCIVLYCIVMKWICEELEKKLTKKHNKTHSKNTIVRTFEI